MMIYDENINVLMQVLKEIEVEYSIKQNKNIINVELNIESIINQIYDRLKTYSKVHRDETGSSLVMSSSINNDILSSTIRIYLQDNFVECKPKYENKTIKTHNGYEII